MDGDRGRRADRPPATERYFLSRGLAVFRECVAKFSCPGCSAWSRPVWQRSAGPLRRLCAVPGVDSYSGAGAEAGLNTHRCRQWSSFGRRQPRPCRLGGGETRRRLPGTP